MPKYLVVVESPAKAKTISKFLGHDYVVRASYGHVRDLPKNELGVDVETNFQPKYVTLREASKAVKAIRDAAATVDEILLASDPDREGEAIGWHIAELLRASKKPIRRIVFNAITKRSIMEAAKTPREIDDNLVNAQQARRVLDRLVGYKISPMLQWGVQKGLSAGRVQSVAVRMVCEREEAIRAFVPEEYWTLDALLNTPRGEELTARLNRVNGEKPVLGSESAILSILKDLEGAEYKVASVERKDVQRRPFPPFITSTLQQDASRKLRFGPQKTMRIAQQLYEGVALGDEGMVGVITYMRTDSTRIEPEAISEVRSFIESVHGAAMLPEKPNFFASKKGAQDAHEAIRPTSAYRTPEAIRPYLTDEQLALYTLIWQRFVASQMAPAVLDQITVDVDARQYGFRAVGSVVKFPGFTKLYEESKDDAGDDEAAHPIPPVSEGELLDPRELKPEQHFTKPPARYTEASLIRALEEEGIGRPSTYAPTINTIQEREYVAREKGRLKPTELGEQVNRILVANFPDILDLRFTAHLEEDLDKVEEGQCEWHALLAEFYGSFSKDLRAAQGRIVSEMLNGEMDCPECGSPLEVREGRFGTFVACSRYPECKTTRRLRKSAPAEPTDQVCELCNAQMVLREGRYGKFLSCSTYPKCKNTKNVAKDGQPETGPPKEPPKKTEEKCPTCGAFLLIRTSRDGEPFFGCEKYPKCRFTRPMDLELKCPESGCEGNLVYKRAKMRRFIGCDQYPKCNFTLSGKPDKKTPCPKCNNPWTVVIAARDKTRSRKCPVPGCGFEVTVDETATEDEA